MPVHVDNPLYYRWAFQPSTGSVTLAHNHEDHPARVRTHLDLAREVNEPGATHGYAYRIGGGWRLHDYERKPVADPYVKTQILKAIRNTEEGGEQQLPLFTAGTPDFERTHYGRPMSL